jgi:phage recombination protein Bet
MSNALAVVGKPQQAISQGFSPDHIDLIRKTLCPDANDAELALFLAQCQRTGLDPFSRQIYFIKRGGRGSTQVSIDGFRVIAERSGEMDGQEVAWCDDSGTWTDVWLKKEPPAAARVVVYRKGCAHSFPAIAKWTEYSQGQGMWTKMPANQLAKCAEALALRKAFPHQLSGLYTPDEMAQAEPQREPVAVEAPRRIALPDGSVQILRAVERSARGASWSDVTFVDSNGVEQTLPTPADGKQASVSLFEQLAQEAIPVWLETTITPRSKKTVIAQVHRQKPEPKDENAALDAEILAAETAL